MTEIEWPPIWLLFATYKSTEISLRTIDSLIKHLKYPNLHWHICDDGSGTTDDGTERWHVGVLADRIAAMCPDVTWHEMDTPPGQYNTGGNINRGIVLARDHGVPIHLLIYDDWALARDLDICAAVCALDEHQELGMVRLSYTMPGIAGICLRYDLARMGNIPYMWFRLIRKWCLSNPWETQAYLVSTQPYVGHLRFFDFYGWHPEHVDPGKAEVGLGAQYNYINHENGPQIVFPIGQCTVHAPWEHLATRRYEK